MLYELLKTVTDSIMFSHSKPCWRMALDDNSTELNVQSKPSKCTVMHTCKYSSKCYYTLDVLNNPLNLWLDSNAHTSLNSHLLITDWHQVIRWAPMSPELNLCMQTNKHLQNAANYIPTISHYDWHSATCRRIKNKHAIEPGKERTYHGPISCYEMQTSSQ